MSPPLKIYRGTQGSKRNHLRYPYCLSSSGRTFETRRPMSCTVEVHDHKSRTENASNNIKSAEESPFHPSKSRFVGPRIYSVSPDEFIERYYPRKGTYLQRVFPHGPSARHLFRLVSSPLRRPDLGPMR